MVKDQVQEHKVVSALKSSDYAKISEYSQKVSDLVGLSQDMLRNLLELEVLLSPRNLQKRNAAKRNIAATKCPIVATKLYEALALMITRLENLFEESVVQPTTMKSRSSAKVGEVHVEIFSHSSCDDPDITTITVDI